MKKLIVATTAALSLVGCGPSEQQKAYRAEAAKNRAIFDANPGAELVVLQCGQLADTQETVGQERARKGLDTTGYSRAEAYRMCLRNKGFEHLLNK